MITAFETNQTSGSPRGTEMGRDCKCVLIHAARGGEECECHKTYIIAAGRISKLNC